MNSKKWLVRILFHLAVIALFAGVVYKLSKSFKKPEGFKPPERVQTVEATRLTPTNFTVHVRSQGVVEPLIQSTLVAEVGGRITEISPDLRAGSFFKTDDLLMQIDDADYKAAVALAEAELAQVEVRESQEQAQAEQAREDWKRLNPGGEPGDLLLRKPQLAEIAANKIAIEATLTKANLDLDRTRITAPYNGRVVEKMVDVGQFVNRGAQLASIYSIEQAEVILPLPVTDRAMLDLPENPGVTPDDPPAVVLQLEGDAAVTWTGKVTRATGRIDPRTREDGVIAEIDQPYAPGRPPLKPGQFVTARIAGRTLEGVYRIPRAALREEREILLVTPENTLVRQPVTILWSEPEYVLIANTLPANPALVTTPLAYAADGAPVEARVDGAPLKQPGQDQKPRPGGRRAAPGN